MRKIYSLMLIAAGLLIGTSLQAQTLITNGDALKAAFEGASGKTTITLGQSFALTEQIVINKQEAEITLDLNGFTITDGTIARMFWLKNGTLTVTGKEGSTIKNEQTAYAIKVDSKDVETHCFFVNGDAKYKKDASTDEVYTDTEGHKSSLTIEENVTVHCAGKCGIAVSTPTNGAGYAYNVTSDVYGTVYGGKYGMQLSGNVKKQDEIPTGKVLPTFNIHPGAVVYAKPTTEESDGIYAAGYGIWNINGCDVHGNTGVYIKGGEITINDAKIASDNPTYTPPTYKDGNTVSGTDAGGSGIIIEGTAESAYAGGKLTVQGNTEVKAISGYAVEAINFKQEGQNKIDGIDIKSGTFLGGTQGCLTMSPDVKAEVQQEGSIQGGSYNGDITEYLSDDTGIITQSEDENGKISYHVSQKEEGQVFILDLNTATPNDLVNVETSVELSKDITAKYIAIKSGATVTIPEGNTLIAGEIVLGSATAVLDIKAGGKVIITGAQGIISENASSLKLEADENEQATFVISPEVITNKQPAATVDLYTFGRMAGTENRVWQRIATPLAVYSSIKHNYVDLGSPELAPGAASFITYMMYYDEASNEWKGLTAYNQMQPFVSYEMDNTSKDGGITYSFTGNLQGNVADNIPLNYAGWNYMANSFTAPMHLMTLLNTISGQTHLDGSIYLWNTEEQSYEVANIAQLGLFDDTKKDIPSLQSFIVKTPDAGTLDIDYEHTIFDYAVNPSDTKYAAPARRIANDMKTMRINIASETSSDNLYLVEGNQFTAAYDNGADAEKFMNKGLNFYAAGDEMDYAMVATDNLEGTMLNIQTVNDINYTLTFSNVRGEMMLKDNLTNDLIAISEGVTYDFVAPANETIEGRFEIVASRTTPTNLQNAHVGANVMKTMQNGRLMIIKNGRCFDAMGATIK